MRLCDHPKEGSRFQVCELSIGQPMSALRKPGLASPSRLGVGGGREAESEAESEADQGRDRGLDVQH